ncbi:uncharacterized protein LOC123543598 [Mercenaria mercenaria]|uniref:uncharacterized protein LOC123543598 n=1 Tax=Mercenaria mercenaria TaxID=6596 RepID=UPI00234F3CBD|nr:uncharacterized protein LOC123543598 [Mercenaria mercenaria]
MAIWMFGGEFHVENSQPGLRNDLWKYSMSKMSWSLVHNGSAENRQDVPGPRQLAAGCGVTETYFVLFGGLGPEEKVLGDSWIFYIPDSKWYTLSDFRNRVSASNSTQTEGPSPRGDMAVWCTGGDMFIFGGFDENSGLHHALWKFSLSTLSWTQSESSAELPADHEFVKHLNYPSGRSGATTWVSDDRLFMFGGNILANNLRSKHMMIGNVGDLWEYDKLQDLWLYYTGPQKVCNTATQFGDLGSASTRSNPGCRRRASSWTDTHGNLWMFGGDGIDNSQASLSVFAHSKLLSDIWFYNLNTNMWTWKGGEKAGDQKGKFGKKGQSSKNNLPGSRCESVVWQQENNFYLFGGVGHDANGKDGYLDDVWMLDVHLDQSVELNAPTALPVFGMIFFSLGLVILISVLYLFSRRYFQVTSGTNKGKYSRIPLDPEQ